MLCVSKAIYVIYLVKPTLTKHLKCSNQSFLACS